MPSCKCSNSAILLDLGVWSVVIVHAILALVFALQVASFQLQINAFPAKICSATGFMPYWHACVNMGGTIECRMRILRNFCTKQVYNRDERMVIKMIRSKKLKYLVLMAVIIACSTAVILPDSAAATLRQQSEELAAITEQIRPAVVSVLVEKRGGETQWRWRRDDPPDVKRFFKEWRWHEGDPPDLFRKEEGPRRFILPFRDKEEDTKGVGTGIIMDEQGHIVTASHIVGESPDAIKVELADKRRLEAKLIGTDPDSGVAVLKIDSEDLKPVRTGNSDDVRAGELVLAFGNRHNQGVFVTMGIVSATRRKNLGMMTYENFIQADVSVSPGSGGGPLVSASGDVIGMIVAMTEESGAAFAVPINTVSRIMDDLVSEGMVARGWLGVQIQEVGADLAEKMELEKPRGALVGMVGGPAEKAGIKAGDVIIDLDGEIIEDTAHLRDVVARTRPGEKVAVTVARKGEKKKLTVEMGKRSKDAVDNLGKRQWKAQGEAGWMGIAAQKLTRELAEEFGYEGEEGVLISEVMAGSPADKKGLRKGDLIQEVEGESIEDVNGFENAVKNAGKSVLLKIRRDDRIWYEVIKDQ